MNKAITEARKKFAKIISDWERNREFLNVSPSDKEAFYERAVAALSVPLPEREGGDKGDGWKPIETAPLDKTRVIIAVPTKDRDDWIIGEASFDPEHYEGGDWWWANLDHSDYHAGPVSECNHHAPEFWQPLPAAPSASIEGETP